MDARNIPTDRRILFIFNLCVRKTYQTRLPRKGENLLHFLGDKLKIAGTIFSTIRIMNYIDSAKKILVILGCLITLNIEAQEQQTTNERKLTAKIGVKGGLNFTNLYVDNVKDENMKLGGNVGLFAKIPLAKGLSFQPELLYSMKGSQLNYNNVFGSGKYRFNLDYVEIPLLAVINVATNFNIQLGGYTAFLASVKVKDVDQNGNIRGVTEFNKNDFQTFDYGLVGGLGFDVGSVTLGARYSYGLKEVGKNGTLSGNITQNSKNSAFSLFLGIGL